ncbi:protein of unknown function [Acidithiobacillus ferrivorans]|uniref:Uncharacterized protein n=1 Tax=Acidithiobacillus ferrivorans TaxID=160808 RepID=A0ABY1MKU4_9PROT|nr:protein of unknown function [Acidithiobacillus ferrivorans]
MQRTNNYALRRCGPPHRNRHALSYLRAGQPEGFTDKTPAVQSHQQEQSNT